MKIATTIAGSDSCGGAGIQADLKTFSALGVYGMSVITAVTAQNTQGVLAVQDISPSIIAKQIDALFQDISIDALKIGMVSQTETIQTIGERLQHYQPSQIVLDPVMISKSGYDLLQPSAKSALIATLLPLATVITPNIPEAEVIANMSIRSIEEMKEAAKTIHALGPKNVLIKGGHLLELSPKEVIDVLYDGNDFHLIKGKLTKTTNTHGTGCTLSSAITAHLALGHTIIESIKRAKDYITIAIEHSFSIGQGVGPTHHFYDLYKKAGLKY